MKSILNCIAFIFLGTMLYAQAPDAPVVSSVSIDPFNDSATLKWTISPSAGITEYWIFIEGAGGARFKIGTVPYTRNYYRFKRSTIKEEGFSVEAHTATQYSTQRVVHTSMLPNILYDSCTNIISLSWGAYQGWSSGVAVYKVFSYPAQVYMGASTSANFRISNILTSGNYGYYVLAISNGTNADSSFSYHAQRNISVEKAPSYMNIAATVSNGKVNVLFELDPNGNVSECVLQSSKEASKDFVDKYTITKPNASVYTWVDDNLDASKDRMYYRIVAMNACNTSVSNSRVANNILLKATNFESINKLDWTAYKPSDTAITYSIVRTNKDAIETITENITYTLFSDNTDSIGFKDYLSDFCYYVESPETVGSINNSLSNQVCLSVSPEIFMSNAFTPNADGKNDLFKPILEFIPVTYVFIVYNRWGNKLFETKDFLAGWDGTMNGKPVAEGVYLYSVNAVAKDAKTVYKNGTVVLVKP